MLVTRPEPEAADSAARLEALGIEAVTLPLLDRATLHTSLPDAKGFAALALTSVNALRALEERGVIDRYKGLKVFAVGDRTAQGAREYGFGDVSSAGGTMHNLVEAIVSAGLAGPVFYPTARHQSGDLAQELAPFGIMVVVAKVYEMRALTVLPAEVIADLELGRFTAALFYSARSAETFASLTHSLSRSARERLSVLCLSEQVAAPLIGAHFVRMGLADHPSEEAMMALALSFARDQDAS